MATIHIDGRSFDVPTDPDFTVPFGKASILREGTDVTLVSFGIGVAHALAFGVGIVVVAALRIVAIRWGLNLPVIRHT